LRSNVESFESFESFEAFKSFEAFESSSPAIRWRPWGRLTTRAVIWDQGRRVLFFELFPAVLMMASLFVGIALFVANRRAGGRDG
jgi:hypothetical protein